MKKVYLVIIYLITIGCVIFGLVSRFAFGNSMNIRIGNFEFGSKDYTYNQDQISPTGIGDSIKLTVDADMGNITIRTGAAYNIEYRCPEKMKLDITYGADYINFVEKNNRIYNFDGYEADITITVPENTTITGLDIENDLGNVIIDGSIIVKDGEIKVDCGNADIKNISFDNLSIEADLGNVDIKSAKVLDNYSIDAEVSLGNLEINGKEKGSDYEQEGSEGKLILKADLGNISLGW